MEAKQALQAMTQAF